MTLQNRPKGINGMIRLGLVFLILASLARLSGNHVSARIPGPIVDGGAGLLYGVSIGCMIVGMKRRSSTGSSPCAMPHDLR
jgi:hypothetical protein